MNIILQDVYIGSNQREIKKIPEKAHKYKEVITNQFRTEDKEAGKCYGGIARLQTAVKELRSSCENLLWVNAGDFCQGTVWYSHFKWTVVAR